MANLTDALRIGTSGLQIAQLALGTVSHNIVNTNTTGFSRQIVQTGALASNGYGNGVQLLDIQRVSDKFVVGRQREAISDQAYTATRQGYLEALETKLSSVTEQGGLDSVISDFFQSVSQLSNDPANSALKRNLVQQSQLVAENLQNANNSLNTVATEADNLITTEIGSINQLILDISSLNRQITAQSISNDGGANANDLLDARDQKISLLSQRFGLQVSQNGNGAVRIATENGRKLLDENSYTQLSRVASTGDYLDIGVQNVQVDGTLSPTVFPLNTNTLTTGKIKALVEIRDTTVVDTLAQIDKFTTVFKNTVNDITSQGSSFPPPSTLTSGNTVGLTSVASDLYTALDPTLVSDTFDLSVVDTQGDVVLTTVGGTALTLPGAGPFTLTQLATLISNNATIGNTSLGGSAGVTAAATTNSSGQPILTITAANSNYRVVLANRSGNVLGILGMNNLFTGTDSNDIAVNTTLATNPDLFPTGRMRSTDGGLSSLDNQNIIALAQMADTSLSFSAAGGLGAQTISAVGYVGQIESNLAVKVSDAKDRATFADNIAIQLDQLSTGVSGVNINEELSQMLVYQNSFQASARIITVVNQLLQDLMTSI